MTKATFAPPRQKANRVAPTSGARPRVPIAEAAVPARARGVVGPPTGGRQVGGGEASDAAKGIGAAHRGQGGVGVPIPGGGGETRWPLRPRGAVQVAAARRAAPTVVAMQTEAGHRPPPLPLAAPEMAARQGAAGGVATHARRRVGGGVPVAVADEAAKAAVATGPPYAGPAPGQVDAPVHPSEVAPRRPPVRVQPAPPAVIARGPAALLRRIVGVRRHPATGAQTVTPRPPQGAPP